jgi:8-oxo-dGTP diphosphatase
MTDDSGPLEETPERVDVALAIPLRDGKLLVARRPRGVHLEGYWEFPGGKIEQGEEPATAARRELEEETGLSACELEPLVIVVHDYREMPLRFHVFLARDARGEPKPDREWAWKSYAELQRLEMPEANRQMLRALRWRLG